MDAPRPSAPLGRIATLVFLSGFCALVYQTAWLRLLRLVFGVSTAASAAVLAIFMGGIGVGSLWLGRRADRTPRPLRLYGRLELGIAIGAAISPLLVDLVRAIYIASGGSLALGAGGAVVVRLLLSVVVLAVPTVLMGGTLPAVARASEEAGDSGRRAVGWLYAANALGAVLGAFIATFWSFELIGVRTTIWLAVVVNLGVVVAALALDRGRPALEPEVAEPPPPAPPPPASETTASETTASETTASVADAPAWLVLIAAAIVGFAFFLIELVWYRMLAPLLGGSSYTFGLILALALLGIGLGGLLYSIRPPGERPTLAGFAATCALEAVFLVAPLAMGDAVAVLALLTRPLAGAGFVGIVGSWTLVTSLVVLPPAIVSGYQFPLLVGLLGRGRAGVGRQVGLAYGCNTAGAILGSLAGGFGLMPLLGAVGVWRLDAALLIALSLVAAGVASWRRPRSLRPAAVAAVAIAGVAAVACLAEGPSAAWRHSPIGAGRLRVQYSGPNDLRRELNEQRRVIRWSADGVESSIALSANDGYSLLVSGKSDGNCRSDAPTQVMGGLIGTLLHPAPERVLIIGLGTGTSAGWAAAVDGVTAVDVVELEPAITKVAEACAPVNHDVLHDPRVELIIADGRELMLTSDRSYDVVFSEPSNPYRAGVASLFTADFYAAVRERMNDDGLFLQWLQAYDVDAETVRTAIATLASVFPAVEIWQSHTAGDLVLIGSAAPIAHDIDRVRARVAEEPYREALYQAWGVSGAEGFYAGFVAGPAVAAAVREVADGRINTDDHPILEFGFARGLVNRARFEPTALYDVARERGAERPRIAVGALDETVVAEMRAARSAWEEGGEPPPDDDLAGDGYRRAQARLAYRHDNVAEAAAHWREQAGAATAHVDHLLLAEVAARAGAADAAELIARVEQASAVEANLLRAVLHAERGNPESTAAALAAAFIGYRTNPWAYPPLVRRGLSLSLDVTHARPQSGALLFDALLEPFAVESLRETRLQTLWTLANVVDFNRLCVPALGPLEPSVPWDERLLALRLKCYRAAGDPRAEVAERELKQFLSRAPAPF